MAESTLTRHFGPSPDIVTYADGTMHFWVIEGRMLASEAHGSFALDAVDDFLERANRLIRTTGKRVSIIGDWRELEGFQPGCRKRMSKWAFDNRANFVTSFWITSNRLTHMAVTVVNMAIGGGMQIFTDESRWIAAVNQAAEQIRRARERKRV